MDLSQLPQEQIIEMMIRLASSLKEEDLEDPATYGMVAQLIQVLDPKPEPLPQDLVDQLSQINDKAERFRQLVASTGQMPSPDIMQRLAASMKAAGLLKREVNAQAGQTYSDKDVEKHWQKMSGNENDPEWETPEDVGAHSKKWTVTQVHPKEIRAHYDSYKGDGLNPIEHGFGDKGKNSSDSVVEGYRKTIHDSPPIILKPSSDPKYKYETLDGVHRTRAAYLENTKIRALIPADSLDKAIFNESEHDNQFHGWISPEGQFYQLDPETMHESFIKRKTGMESGHQARRAGWISVGHAGDSNICAAEHIITNKKHPAVKALRELVGKHRPDETLELEQIAEVPQSKIPTTTLLDSKIFSKYGTIKKPLAKIDFGAKYGKPANPIHGWISPEGQYHHMEPSQDHHGFISATGLGSMHDAYEKGWISAGHAGFLDVGAHESVITNKNHPATRKLRELVGEHWPEEFTLAIRRPNRTDDHMMVNNKAFAKYGTVKRSDPAMKSELAKEDWSMGEAKLHGLISPEGKYFAMKPKEYHHRRLMDKADMTEKEAYKAGWITVGHAGSNHHMGSVLKNPRHPATMKLRSLMAEKGMHDEDLYLNAISTSDSTTAPKKVDASHFIKHGTWKEVLRKYDFGREDIPYPQGWISPAGEFHQLQGEDEHGAWMHRNHAMTQEQAHDAGWVSLGHGGYGNASGHERILSSKQHPATKKLREMLGQHDYPEGLQLEVHHGGGDSSLKFIDSNIYSKYGTLKGHLGKSEELTKAKFSNAKPRRKKGQKPAANQNRRGLVQRVQDALADLKAGKNSPQYSGISTVGSKARPTALGAKNNSIYSYGPHWPVASVLDHKTVALNMNTYGGQTGDIVNSIRRELPTQFPESKIIHVHHPDYIKASQIMRGGHKAIVEHLKDASQNHPDPEHKKRAQEDLDYMESIEKSTREKRDAFIGYDDVANSSERINRMGKLFGKYGLKVSPHMGPDDDSKGLGAKGPNAINSTPDEGPTEQQLLHEAAHAVNTPVGSTLAEYQEKIGRPGDHGTSTKYAKKQGVHPEKVAQYMEAGLARRAGMSPFRTREGYKNPKTGLGRAHSEAKQTLQDLDEGIKRIDPVSGEMKEGTSIHAKINLRARKKKLIKAQQSVKQWQAEVERRRQEREDAKNPEAAKARKKTAMDAAVAAIQKKPQAPKKPDGDQQE